MNNDKLKVTFLSLQWFHGGKVTRMMDFLGEKMNKECGLDGDLVKTMSVAKELKDRDIIRDLTFVILHDDKNLYCASLMKQVCIQTRWVPPKHRGKGYATLMLRKIEEMFQGVPHEHLPVWIVSYMRMNGLNTRAGWIMNPEVNTDRRTGEIDPSAPEQHDWFPPWGEAAYRRFGRTEDPELVRAYWREYDTFVQTYGGSKKGLDLRYT